MFLHVCHSVHRVGGGVCLSACWDTSPPPQEQTPLGPGTPQSRPPQTRHPSPGSRHHPPWDQALPRPGTPPEPTPPPRETATVADGTQPTGMHSCSYNFCLNIFALNEACLKGEAQCYSPEMPSYRFLRIYVPK